MRDQLVLDLTDCTEYRQALMARPPRVVHGTLALLVALLASALMWSALTTVDLVVRGTGRIRPTTTPVKVVNAARGEILSGVGGRIVEVGAREGDRVRRGDVLIRLETDRLDNEIAKLRNAIRAGEEELERLARLERLLDAQQGAARAKAEAELAQARQAVDRAEERRRAEIRLAESGLAAAEEEAAPLRKLVQRGASAPSELTRVTARIREARQQQLKAQLPVDASGVDVARRALELAERDHETRREELGLKLAGKRSEIQAARHELAGRVLGQAQAIIRSPIDGVVTSGDFKVGDLLEPGQTVAEIAEEAGFLFEAAIPSEEVDHLRPGLPVRIKLDAYDYQKYGTLDGTVGFISPDSGVPEGQRAAYYVVRVRTARAEVGQGPLRGEIKLGMTGEAEVVTERDRLLSLLIRRIRRTISLG